jgi:hypothetical protein
LAFVPFENYSLKIELETKAPLELKLAASFL